MLAGIGTYSGVTTINAGDLVVNGPLASPLVTVNTGILSGTGSVTNVTVNSGGTLSPGDARVP